eukprot:gene13125-biopygen8628
MSRKDPDDVNGRNGWREENGGTKMGVNGRKVDLMERQSSSFLESEGELGSHQGQRRHVGTCRRTSADSCHVVCTTPCPVSLRRQPPSRPKRERHRAALPSQSGGHPPLTIPVIRPRSIFVVQAVQAVQAVQIHEGRDVL